MSMRERAREALRLFQETVQVIGPMMQPEHRDVAEQAVRVIDEALAVLSEQSTAALGSNGSCA
jgi:hypothetical protein